MPGADDHPQIPSEIPPHPLSEFDYDNLEKGDRVGTGGDADVYYATIDRNGESYPVAVKEPRFEGTLNQQVLDRFRNEAETWAKLDDHDNIVTVYSWSATPVPWLALEYMDGGTLTSRIQSANVAEALWLSGRIAEGIHYGHRHGVAHLDIKPSNILLRETQDDAWDYPKVSDWGLAQLLLDHSKSIEGLSPTYAAPEQFDADEFGSPDDITDIYQFGTVVYALLTGEQPFSGSATSIMKSVLQDEPQPPSEINPAVPSAVDEILSKALAKQKEERYQGILPLLQDINKVFNSYVDDASADRFATTERPGTATTRSTTKTPTDTDKSSSQTGLGKVNQERTGKQSSGARSSDVKRRAVLALLGIGTVGAGVAAVTGFTGNQSPATGDRASDTLSTQETPGSGASGSTTYGDVEQDWALNLDADTGATVEAWNYQESVLLGRHEFDGPHQFMRVSKDGDRIWARSDIPDTHSIYESSVATGTEYVVVGMSRESSYTLDPPNEDSGSPGGALIHCYDSETGELVWQHETNTENGEFILSTVNVSQSGIVTAAVDGRASQAGKSTASVYGIDLDTGTERWRHDSFGDDTVERIEDTIIYDGNCFASGFFGSYLIDVESGELVDRNPEPRFPYFDISVEDQYIYGTDSSVAVKFDMTELTSVWETELSAGSGQNCLIGANSVFTDDRNGYVYSFDKISGQQNWRQRVQGSTVGMALTSRYLWVSDTNRGVRAYDPATGERIFNPATFATGTAVAEEQIPLVGWDESVFIGGTPSGRYSIQQ
jgi:serine/threonine-protein kinase